MSPPRVRVWMLMAAVALAALIASGEATRRRWARLGRLADRHARYAEHYRAAARSWADLAERADAWSRPAAPASVTGMSIDAGFPASGAGWELRTLSIRRDDTPGRLRATAAEARAYESRCMQEVDKELERARRYRSVW